MANRVLIVGGGGREHAIVWALARSPQVDEVIAAPGNPGMAGEPGCRVVGDVSASDVDAVVGLAAAEDVAMVVVGPEDPLVAGLVDRLADHGIAAFGPSAAAARLEGSKSHCKAFCRRHGIPTASGAAFSGPDSALAFLEGLDAVPVVKADGLAGGKGVVVASEFDEAAEAIRSIMVDGRFGAAGAEVLLEERLVGAELSVLCFADGRDFAMMPVAVDHKRLRTGNGGPNTGGMGAYHRPPVATDAVHTVIRRRIVEPVLAGLVAEGRPYRGVLYAGLMLTDDGPKVIEINCRFGDPEAEAIIPLLSGDIHDVFAACVSGRLGAVAVDWANRATTTVVMASAGYPEASSPPAPIRGLDAVPDDCLVFHAGTSMINGVLHATGGRVLAVTAVAPSLAEATETAYAGVAAIDFDGAQYRDDIARSPVRS